MNKEQGTRNNIEQGTRNIELRSEWLRSIFFIPCSLFNIQKVLCGSIPGWQKLVKIQKPVLCYQIITYYCKIKIATP